MEKKFLLNKISLGNRIIGWEIFSPETNGGEVIGMTTKTLMDAIKTEEVLGMVLDEKGSLQLDAARGFKAMMVKTGAGTLTSTDASAVANLMYTVYGREGDKFKVVTSRFGRQVFCEDKIKALLDLGAVNGVVLDGEKLVCSWELHEGQGVTQGTTEEKKKGA